MSERKPNFIEEIKLIGIIRTETAEQALSSARAIIAGGFKIVEITLTVPDALNIIRELKRVEGLHVGAGTILDEKTAEKAIEAGAEFLVSPHTDPAIIRVCNGRPTLSIPGAATATEVLLAHRSGADLIKIFPAQSFGGPAHLRFLRGPLPFVKLLPTGSISLENMDDYFAAGAVAVGITNHLIDMQLIKNGHYASITEMAARFAAKVEHRTQSQARM